MSSQVLEAIIFLLRHYALPRSNNSLEWTSSSLTRIDLQRGVSRRIHHNLTWPGDKSLCRGIPIEVHILYDMTTTSAKVDTTNLIQIQVDPEGYPLGNQNNCLFPDLHLYKCVCSIYKYRQRGPSPPNVRSAADWNPRGLPLQL